MLGFAKRNPASSAISLCFVNKGMMTTPPESDRRVLWGLRTHRRSHQENRSSEERKKSNWSLVSGRRHFPKRKMRHCKRRHSTREKQQWRERERCSSSQTQLFRGRLFSSTHKPLHHSSSGPDILSILKLARNIVDYTLTVFFIFLGFFAAAAPTSSLL